MLVQLTTSVGQLLPVASEMKSTIQRSKVMLPLRWYLRTYAPASELANCCWQPWLSTSQRARQPARNGGSTELSTLSQRHQAGHCSRPRKQKQPSTPTAVGHVAYSERTAARSARKGSGAVRRALVASVLAERTTRVRPTDIPGSRSHATSHIPDPVGTPRPLPLKGGSRRGAGRRITTNGLTSRENEARAQTAERPSNRDR